jgi:transposase
LSKYLESARTQGKEPSMSTSYIGADVDCKMTELAVERDRKVVRRERVPTDIASLREFLGTVRGPKVMVIEEGPMSGWLYRNLRREVERLVVCDPRRNKSIYDDGDKTDPVDAAGLAALQRGGYTREVYHTLDEDRLALKEIVALYHDRVQEAVRQVNKLRAQAKAYGQRIPRAALEGAKARGEWMGTVQPTALRERLEILWRGWDVVRSQAKMAKAHVSRRAKAYGTIAVWQEVPGVGLIRAATLYAYLDTPDRFASEKKLYKYCGLGLKRSASGTDPRGRPKEGRLCLYRRANHRLKDALLGAALSAVSWSDNPLRQYYRACVKDGMTESNARHSVGRKILRVLVALWKTGRRYDASRV